MATHRDSNPADSGGSGYPGRAYPNVDYPSPERGYPAQPEGPAGNDTTEQRQRRYAERIPRYPDAPERPEREWFGEQGPDPRREPAPQQRADRPPQMDEELRLVGTDLPGVGPEPFRDAPHVAREAPDPARPVPPGTRDAPTAAYPMTAPPMTPVTSVTPGTPVTPATSGPPVAAQRGPTPPTPPAPPTAGQGGGAQPGSLGGLLQHGSQNTEPVGGYPATGVSSAGRGQLALLLGVATIVLEVPVAVILVRSLVGSVLSVSGVVTGMFLLPGLPVFAAGLYPLLAGTLRPRPGEGLAVLARRPVALLLVGALLLVVAGLAAG
ncbi:MAG: hypothetical protein WCA46_19580 [Actinocatenispora sp.]